jgi:isochorismate synthase
MDITCTSTITFDILHALALDNELSFVTYRLPGNAEVTTLLQWKQEPAVIHDINELKHSEGFVFAPFDLQDKSPIRIISPDLILKGSEIMYADKTILQKSGSGKKAEEPNKAENYITVKSEFISQVEQIQQRLSDDTLQKVVLSRIHSEIKEPGFDTSLFFQALEQAYPDAFVFVLYIPDAGLWFGASPEPLLLIRNGLVSTVSLAGTRPAGDKRLPWGEKEIDEQQIVTRYIENLLERFNISDVETKGPFTYQAGSIEHLKTIFTFHLEELRNDPTHFLKELHPTPSVCGLPKELAREVIGKTEKHQREYYTGFLGPVNMDDQWNLFVNLRCMKLCKKQMDFYLGAGITVGSKAEDEWDETRNKMITLKSIIESLKKNQV